MKSEKWISEHVWNLMTLRSKKYIALITVLLLVGLVLGFMVGTYTTVKAFAKMASGFIDPRLVEQAYWQFKNNVGACFPPLI